MAHHAETRHRAEPESGKAIAAFGRAVGLDPGFHDARFELINLLLKTSPAHGGSRAAAERHVEALEAADAVSGVRGRCMLMAGKQPDVAVELWKGVVAAHPTRADAHAGLTKAYLRIGDLDRAAAQLDQAVRLDPSHNELWLSLCRQSASEQDLARARRAVERYLAATLPHRRRCDPMPHSVSRDSRAWRAMRNGRDAGGRGEAARPRVAGEPTWGRRRYSSTCRRWRTLTLLWGRATRSCLVPPEVSTSLRWGRPGAGPLARGSCCRRRARRPRRTARRVC